MRSTKIMHFRSILFAVIFSSGLSACGGGMGGGGYPMMGYGMGGMGYGMERGPTTVFGSPNGWGHTQNDVIVDDNRRNVVVDNNNGSGRDRDDVVVDSNRDRNVAMDNNKGWNRDTAYDNKEQAGLNNRGMERSGGFYHPGRI